LKSLQSLPKVTMTRKENPAGAQENHVSIMKMLFQAIRYAPGEVSHQCLSSMIKMLKLLSFPTIYCGQKRNLNPTISFHMPEISKSEARRYDRRGCTPAHILYQYKLQQIIRVHNAVSISLRKKKVGTATAGQVRDSINDLA